jgi:hypothetical protein
MATRAHSERKGGLPPLEVALDLWVVIQGRVPLAKTMRFYFFEPQSEEVWTLFSDPFLEAKAHHFHRRNSPTLGAGLDPALS